MLSAIRQRVETYCAAHPDLSTDVAASLRRLTVRKGMDPEQVVAIFGLPGQRRQLSDGSVEWTYDDRSVWGIRRLYYSWGKLRFEDGRVGDIKVKQVKIYK